MTSDLVESTTPPVLNMDPDESLLRYRFDELRQYKSSKSLLFEKIDFTIYSPHAHMCGFETSVERLPLWIDVILHRYFYNHSLNECLKITWDESFMQQQNKSEKVALQFYYKDVKLITITIFNTTGRIQCQGKYHHAWGEKEFPLLLQLVNNIASNPNSSADKKSYSNTFDSGFLISAPTTHQPLDENILNTKNTAHTDEIHLPDGTDLNIKDSTNPANASKNKTIDDSAKLFISPLRLNTLTTLRETVSKLESNFVDFSSNTENALIVHNDKIDQLSILRDKIVQLENLQKVSLQTYDEKVFQISNEQQSLSEQLRTMENFNKKLQEKHNNLSSKHSKLQSDFNEIKSLNDHLRSEVDSLKSLVTDLIENKETEKYANTDNVEKPTTPTVNAYKEQTPETENSRCAETTVSSDKEDCELSITKNILHKNRFEVLRDLNEEEDTKKSDESQELYMLPKDKHKSSTTQILDKIVILCDSNGKFIDKEKLSTKPTEVLRCPTLHTAKEIIENTIQQPQVLIIHCGTNDLEHLPPDQVEEQSINLINLAANKHPKTKIIFSTLLSRKDSLNFNIARINQNIQKKCSHVPNIHFVSHDISEDQFFFDHKHLNQRGFRIFINGIKGAIYGTTPRRRTIINDPRISVNTVAADNNSLLLNKDKLQTVCQPSSSISYPQTVTSNIRPELGTASPTFAEVATHTRKNTPKMMTLTSSSQSHINTSTESPQLQQSMRNKTTIAEIITLLSSLVSS